MLPSFGSAGHQAQAVGGVDMTLRALDVKTGEYKWIHKYAGSEWNPPRPHRVGGLLSTAGGLLFAGNPAGYMVAYDAVTGESIDAWGRSYMRRYVGERQPGPLQAGLPLMIGLLLTAGLYGWAVLRAPRPRS